MKSCCTTRLLLLLAILSPHPALASPAAPQQGSAQPLTLDAAVATALRDHPSLKEAEASVAAAEAEVRIARSAYFPQISFDAILKAGLSGTTGALGLPGFPASPFYRNFAYSANWYQSIFDFGRIQHTVAMERALYRSSQFKQKAEQQRIVLAVKRAYFAALEAQQEESVAQAVIKDQKLNAAKAEEYEEAGLGADLETHLAQTQLTQAQEVLVRAQNAVAVSYAALRTAMGVNGSETYELQVPAFQPSPQPPLSILVEEAMKNRPDEQAVEFKTQALRASLGLARAQGRPDLAGFGAGGGGRFNGTSVPDDQRHGVAALGFIVPVFTGGRLKAQRDEARAELKGALAAEELLHQQIRLEVTEAWYQIPDLSKQLESVQHELVSAKGTYDLARTRDEAGLGSDLEMLSARTALMKTQEKYLRLQMDIEQAKAQLDFVTGKKAF